MKVWLAVFGLALVAACTTDFPCAEIGGELDVTGQCVFPEADAGSDADVPLDAPVSADASAPLDASDASAPLDASDASAPLDASDAGDATPLLDAASDG